MGRIRPPEKWYHMGLMYLSPYELAVMEVEQVADLLEVDPDPKRVYISTLHIYKNMFEAMAPFVDSDIITVKWYEVEEAPRRIASFRPQVVPAIAMRGDSWFRWWPRAIAVRAGGGRSAGAGDTGMGGEVIDEGEDPDEHDDAAGDDSDLKLPEPEVEEVPDFEELLDPVFDAYEEFMPPIIEAPEPLVPEPAPCGGTSASTTST